MSEYKRADWIGDGWYSHGGITQEALAKAKSVAGDGNHLCPYTNELYAADKMQLDHVLPLGYLARIAPPDYLAHMTGGLTLAVQHHMGHAECNLLLVSAHANEAKGERSISEWLPPYASFRKPYAAIWRYCIYAFGLERRVPEADWQAIAQLLGTEHGGPA